MNTFEFLHRNMASILLPNVSNDIVSDCSRAFKTSYLRNAKPGQKEGKPGRLSGWAIVKEGELILQSDLSLSHPNLKTADTRTKYQAWFYELSNFEPPICFLGFTQSTTNLNNVFLTYDLRVVTICSPSSFERFNYLTEPGEDAGQAHRLLYKAKVKHAV
jgi:hypothetical protein